MTGFSSFEVSVVGKLLEALKEIAPHTARVALMFHPDITAATDYRHLLEDVAPSFSVKSIAAPTRDPAEIERTIDALAKEPSSTGFSRRAAIAPVVLGLSAMQVN